MDKFTVSVITIIDDYEDKLPYLYESLLLNTQNNINIIWNIYCNEGNEFGKNIIEYFEDLDKETNAGFLKIKTFYGELNRFDAEELLVKNSYGDFLINAETNTVFLGDAFKKLKDNAFMIEDIYGFAFLEKDMPKYTSPNKNIKYIDLNIKENKYNFPIFYNLEMRKNVSNNYTISEVFNISRNCPNMVNFELDKKGYIFALNIPIMQKIVDKEEIRKINKNEEKEEEIFKKILESPIGFKNFYENIFSLGIEYFKNSKTKLKKHIDRYAYTLYILNKKPNLENILDNKMKKYILFRNFINQIKYKIKYKNEEEQKHKNLYEEKEKLKERYLNLSKIDKLNENNKTNKNNNIEDRIKTISNNIDIERINKKDNEQNISEEKDQIKEKEILKQYDIEKTVKLNFKDDVKNNSDYNNYIRNMRLLKNGEKLNFGKEKDDEAYKSDNMEKTKILKTMKDEKELSFSEKLEFLEKSINDDLAEYEKYKKKYENNLEKDKINNLNKGENIDFDLLLDKTALTKKLEKIKLNREESLENTDISKNTVEVNLEILKKLEKEEERLLKEKKEEKKNKKKIEEEKRNKAWKEYLNSHFSDENNKTYEVSVKENIKEDKISIKKDSENKNENEEKLENKKLKCLNEDGTVKILDNLDEKKEKYLKIIKEKKQKKEKDKNKKDIEEVSDYLFGEEFQ